MFGFCRHCVDCASLSEPAGVGQLLPSAVCLAQEAIGTSGACCLCSFPCCQLILCTRLRVHDSRHAAHNGLRKSHVFILFVHGKTVTCFGEPSETDGGGVGCGTRSKSSKCWLVSM